MDIPELKAVIGFIETELGKLPKETEIKASISLSLNLVRGEETASVTLSPPYDVGDFERRLAGILADMGRADTQ